MTASIRGCDIPFLSMHIQTQPFNGPLFGTTQVGRYQKKTFTHSQLSWSSNILYLLWSIASSLFNLRCLRVLFHSLSPGPLWSTSWSGTLYWILHEFRHPIIINFLQYMPIPLQPVLLWYRVMSSGGNCWITKGWDPVDDFAWYCKCYISQGSVATLLQT